MLQLRLRVSHLHELHQLPVLQLHLHVSHLHEIHPLMVQLHLIELHQILVMQLRLPVSHQLQKLLLHLHELHLYAGV